MDLEGVFKGVINSTRGGERYIFGRKNTFLFTPAEMLFLVGFSRKSVGLISPPLE
jgi:hypothetical protein